MRAIEHRRDMFSSGIDVRARISHLMNTERYLLGTSNVIAAFSMGLDARFLLQARARQQVGH
jgi:hypothetical protein